MGNNWNKGTISVQGGYTPKVGEPRILPIFQTTTYKYEDVDQIERLFALKESGYKYSRTGNPTVAAFEAKITQLEGGIGAIATASGQAANVLAITNICKAGDHIIASSEVYGGTYSFLFNTIKRYGVEATFVNPDASEEDILKEFKPNTKAIFGETIGNPGLNILDFDKFASIARKKDVPFIVDNTLATPYLCNPLKLGANVVTHSATKYIDGHATSIGGVVIDGGNYNWNNGKFPDFINPDPSYNGVSYLKDFGKAAYITKARAQLLRDIGYCLSPFNAFLFNLGLETLHLRMKQHSNNALNLAKFLKKHDKVNWVVYPGLEDNDNYEKFKKYFEYGASGVLTFGIKGGTKAVKTFVKNLKLAALVVHVGDARTSVLHPATSTHAQLTEEQQKSAGITPDMIRVSVGIEDSEDIIADFDQALKTI